MSDLMGMVTTSKEDAERANALAKELESQLAEADLTVDELRLERTELCARIDEEGMNHASTTDASTKLNADFLQSETRIAELKDRVQELELQV
mmetsp:Transcript_1044/g.1746  ORF Transcript_1044/g.1746 Transcript_1044/m.1746 type:complete len:93 (+) Transcript_1044:1979-2257(+)